MIDICHKSCLTVLMASHNSREDITISELHKSISALHNEVETVCNAFSTIQENLRMEIETVNTLGEALTEAIRLQPSLMGLKEIKDALVLYALVTGEQKTHG
jgi:archaellum component FlaC